LNVLLAMLLIGLILAATVLGAAWDGYFVSHLNFVRCIPLASALAPCITSTRALAFLTPNRTPISQNFNPWQRSIKA
jgi:hypothetical protein